MVNRPPPKRGGSHLGMGTESNGGSSVRSKGPKQGLEWSLRSLHSIDTGAQHFLSTYYTNEVVDVDGGSNPFDAVDSVRTMGGGDFDEEEEDQTAHEIFKESNGHSAHHGGRHHHRSHNNKGHGTAGGGGGGGTNNDAIWAALHVPLRKGIVDGRQVVFELVSDVTQAPKVPRHERLKRRNQISHSQRSTWETRTRLWLMHFRLSTLFGVFLAAFIALNVLFALFFYYSSDNHCCGDPEMTFGDVFAFTIQTSTTIGYGSFSPDGMIVNFLVVILSYASTLFNTIFAGLIFTKFVTPAVNIQFSNVMTLSNVNGMPCLSVRLGNADGYSNRLTDINVRLTYSFQIPYVDHKGDQKYFRQTEELKLLESRRNSLLEVWQLRHVLDESSPLFGLHWEEHPANKITIFTLSVDAVQELTKSSVNVQADYALEDILVGHSFLDPVEYDEETKVATSDFSKMSQTEPYPVWYPARRGKYGHDETMTPIKSFGPG
mmetsp:Transcript_11445/g.25496  ORF Transcript_11445/g.25496 Transcript_11445/m.25496 type:complete len:489 (-) Transcript_11445:433-1899(-)